MVRTRAIGLLMGTMLALGACSDGGDPGPDAAEDAPIEVGFDFEELSSPSAGISALPNLSRDGAGRVLMSWVESDDDGDHLRFARYTGEGWSAPRTIASGDDWFVNWADFPSLIALPSGTLAAHWLQKEGEGTYAYGVRIVRSEDAGRSWSDPIAPHDDGTETEHGFVSLYPAGDDAVGVIWLDGRETAGGGHGGHGAPASAGDDGELVGMTLRHAIIGADGSSSEARLLDDLTCDCCQTAAATTADGVVFFYRDRQPDEVRDIHRIVRSPDGWSSDVVVHPDGWVIPGCPVNGPAADATGSAVAVAWFTAVPEPRVQVAFSHDGGRHFDAPVVMPAPPEPLGRVDLVHLGDSGTVGQALVSWLAETQGGAVLRVRLVGEDGEISTPFDVVGLSPARSSGFPRIERLGDRSALVAWTEVRGEGRGRETEVKVARLSW